MVYDCFIFFNELDLLEIRLNELKDVVDKFVIVESTETFSKKKKKLYYDENKDKDRFSKFKDKIIHIIVEDSPEKISTKTESENRWAVEHFQRNCIARGLTNCKPDDIILVSDVDEIPRVSSINKSLEILNENKMSIVSFRQRFFYYFLNGLCVEKTNASKMSPWMGTTACRYEGFIGAEKMRKTKGRNKLVLDDAGWHFSYLGGPEKIAYKIESFSHSEYDNSNIKDKTRIMNRIENGMDLFDRPNRPKQVYVEIDESFPEYLKNNIEKFKHLIKEKIVKVGLVITNHYSQTTRPYGRDLLANALKSFTKFAKFNYEIIIVDNQSDNRVLKSPQNIHSIYIEDQMKKGLTGAWNVGIKAASQLGCDIILNSNDDLIFNETINNFVNHIKENKQSDISLFGPLTNGVPDFYKDVQLSNQADSTKTREVKSKSKKEPLISGFFFGFTNKFYKKFMYPDGDLFAEFDKFDKSYIHKYAYADGKWGGQEGEFLRWQELGGKVFVVGDCWIDHLKKKDWHAARCRAGEFGWHLTEGYQ